VWATATQAQASRSNMYLSASAGGVVAGPGVVGLNVTGKGVFVVGPTVTGKGVMVVGGIVDGLVGPVVKDGQGSVCNKKNTIILGRGLRPSLYTEGIIRSIMPVYLLCIKFCKYKGIRCECHKSPQTFRCHN